MKLKKLLLFLVLIAFISTTISCKSSRKKNRCNTCPTWDQVDLSQDNDE